jgi:hypothetical protein
MSKKRIHILQTDCLYYPQYWNRMNGWCYYMDGPVNRPQRKVSFTDYESALDYLSKRKCPEITGGYSVGKFIQYDDGVSYRIEGPPGHQPVTGWMAGTIKNVKTAVGKIVHRLNTEGVMSPPNIGD